MPRYQQQGVAIILVLTIVAVLIPLLSKLAFDQQLLTKKVSVGAHHNNAHMYALAVETWARQLLKEDAGNNVYDGLDDKWAYALPPLTVDAGAVSGKVEDLQGRLNINNLNAGKEFFREKIKALFALKGGLEQEEAEAIIQALEDWMDVEDAGGIDSVRVPYGAEDSDYMILEVPYRTANQPMRSISELRLIKGMTDELWDKVSGFLTTLPAATKINVNTAPLEVLLILFPPEAHTVLQWFDAERKRPPPFSFSFKTMDAFVDEYEAQVGEAMDADLKDILDVKSKYFLATVAANFGEGNINMQSILHRPGRDVRVWYRSFGDL